MQYKKSPVFFLGGGSKRCPILLLRTLPKLDSELAFLFVGTKLGPLCPSTAVSRFFSSFCREDEIFIKNGVQKLPFSFLDQGSTRPFWQGIQKYLFFFWGGGGFKTLIHFAAQHITKTRFISGPFFKSKLGPFFLQFPGFIFFILSAGRMGLSYKIDYKNPPFLAQGSTPPFWHSMVTPSSTQSPK